MRAFVLKRNGTANLADLTKITIILIKRTYKDSMKTKKVRRNISKCRYEQNLRWVSRDLQIFGLSFADVKLCQVSSV